MFPALKREEHIIGITASWKAVLFRAIWDAGVYIQTEEHHVKGESARALGWDEEKQGQERLAVDLWPETQLGNFSFFI